MRPRWSDVAEVGDGDATVRLFNRSDRLLARKDTVDKVAEVSIVARKVDLAGPDVLIDEIVAFLIDGSAVDPYGAFGTLEGHAAPGAIGDDEARMLFS